MPQVGESRTYNGETRTWNGSRWEGAAASPAQAAPEGSALSRFFGGAMKTSPLNPMNLVRAVSSPGETIAGMMADPLANMLKVPGDIKAAITGERGDRLSAAAEALMHTGGSVPLIGPAGIRAGEKIGEGDVAGGAGELAGIASGALVPKIAGKAPRGMQAVGRGMEATGEFLKNKGSVNVGGMHIPVGTAIGLGEAAMGHGPAGLATAAAPYALEYGGKGLSAAGRALERLKDSGTPETVNRFPKLRPNTEVPYRAPSDLSLDDLLGPEGPQKGFDWPEAGGRFEPDATGSHVLRQSPIEEFYRTNPMGEGRTTTAGRYATDSGVPLGEGGLDSLASLSKAKTPASSIMADMEDDYGHGPTPMPKPWEAGVPDFTFDGEANVRPGEFSPSSQTIGEVGEPIGDTPLQAKYLEQLMSSPSFAALSRLGRR